VNYLATKQTVILNIAYLQRIPCSM